MTESELRQKLLDLAGSMVEAINTGSRYHTAEDVNAIVGAYYTLKPFEASSLGASVAAPVTSYYGNALVDGTWTSETAGRITFHALRGALPVGARWFSDSPTEHRYVIESEPKP